MTPSTSRPSSRRASRLGALLLVAALPVLVAVPAQAEVPEGWSDPDEVGLLQLLTVILGIPAVLLVLIVLAVMLPPLARGEKLLPSTAPKDQWFGGPGQGVAELESAPRRELGPTGGASGTW